MKKITLFLTLLLLSSLLLAGEPVEFRYKGKMIHPLCIDHFTTMERIKNRRIDKNLKALGTFYSRGEGPTVIELSKCHDINKKFKSEKDGAQSYSANPSSREMFQYKVILNISENTFLVETLWNGGGTGYFSGLIVFKIEKDKLFLVSEGAGIGGDRCNGGIRIENIKSKSFTLVKNLTPVDLIEVTQLGKNLKIEAYEDLESSAMSCVARKRTHVYTEKGKVNSKLLGYNIDELGNEDSSWVKKYKYQKCFNRDFKAFKLSLKNNLIP